MTDIRTIELKDVSDDMITIDELCKIVGQTKLTVQKKINTSKLATIAMLKTGKPGRPSRLFNRGEINALFDIQTSPASSVSENVSSSNENNQNSIVDEQVVSPPQ
jgi:hypothetical protein